MPHQGRAAIKIGGYRRGISAWQDDVVGLVEKEVAVVLVRSGEIH